MKSPVGLFHLAGELDGDACPVGKVAGPVANGWCFFMIWDDGCVEFCDGDLL